MQFYSTDAYCDAIDNYSSEVKKLFEKLSITVRRDVSLTEDLLKLQGALEMILATANCANDIRITATNTIDEITG